MHSDNIIELLDDKIKNFNGDSDKFEKLRFYKHYIQTVGGASNRRNWLSKRCESVKLYKGTVTITYDGDEYEYCNYGYAVYGIMIKEIEKGNINIHSLPHKTKVEMLNELHKEDELMNYASYIMEMKREQRGLKYDDTSQDKEIIKDLQRGEKLSKSKHLKQ